MQLDVKLDIVKLNAFKFERMLGLRTLGLLVILDVFYLGGSILSQGKATSDQLDPSDVSSPKTLDRFRVKDLMLLQAAPEHNQIIKLVVDQDISQDLSTLPSVLNLNAKHRLDVSKLDPDNSEILQLNSLIDEIPSDNVLESSTSEDVGSKPVLVFPLPNNEESGCLIRNRSTSFRIDKDSLADAIDTETDSSTYASDCLIIVEKAVPSICKLSFELHEPMLKDKEAKNDEQELCKNGGIQIHTQENEHNRVQKICNFQKKFHIFPFEKDTIRITLPNTRIDVSRNDFNFTVRQINCPDHHSLTNLMQDRSSHQDSHDRHEGENWENENALARSNFPLDCNQVIDQEEFVLQSPNYPSKYPNNVDCTTIVYPSSNNICALGKLA